VRVGHGPISSPESIRRLDVVYRFRLPIYGLRNSTTLTRRPGLPRPAVKVQNDLDRMQQIVTLPALAKGAFT